MPKNKRPSYYAAPLKSRKQIIEFLLAHEHYHRDQWSSSPLAWNVKCYNVDFSAEHLIEFYRKSGEYGPDERWLDYPEWREPALEAYKEIESSLWEWAQESAARGVTDDDMYRCLWKGTTLDAKYEFHGRMGGWLLMVRFQGTKLIGMQDYEFEYYLENLEFNTLRNLYELVVQNDHDFRKEAVREALEWGAAEAWIDNVCASIPKPDKTQAELPLEV